MSDRDELAGLILSEFHEGATSASSWRLNPTAAADKVLAAGYRKPRTVTTAEEMDKLRFQAVVLDAYGTPYVCERHATDGTRNEWKPAGMGHLDESDTILYHGPAVVVYEGEPQR